MQSYQTFTAALKQLDQTLAKLISLASRIGVAEPVNDEWYELLQNKLIRQIELPPLLIVAVVGGTNIGKSTIFNHLAGEMASAAEPLAAGTKHPVCLVPPELADVKLLGRLFESFTLRAWHSPEDPLSESEENLLFWRIGQNMPSRLLIVDVPDVDSDVEVNWQRARTIRQTADVLIAVLTQQKYNDAAIKKFFRTAVESQKPIIVVFNQCDLEADRLYWPQWLATFCQNTGARPEMVYVVPYDRLAAEELRLPFFATDSVGESAPATAGLRPASLREDLASLRFDAIKIQTFRGAIGRIIEPARGLPGYLKAIHIAASEFQKAADALHGAEVTRIGWPSLPTSILVAEIRRWWDESRPTWSRRIHGIYRVVGRGATWPIRAAWQAFSQEATSDPLLLFQKRERAAIIMAVEKLLDELERLSQVGNDTLRPRLQQLLSGHAREGLLARIQAAHENMPAVDEDYREFLYGELDAWRQSNPRAVKFLQSLDHVAALARPAITVFLFFTGLHFAGDIVGQAATHAAGATVGHIATEAAIAGGITGGGEAIINTTGEGVRQAAARLFGRLQARYVQQRAGWLAQWLEQELLGDLLADLRFGATVPEMPEVKEVENLCQLLATLSE